MSETRRTILIVDDLPANRYIVCRMLKHAQYATIEAASGGEAIEKARRHRPDAIVLDMNLPDQNGVATLKKLRAHTETASIPVLILSADSHSAFDKNSAEAFGASAYLFTPVPAETLVCVLNGIIERGVDSQDLTI